MSYIITEKLTSTIAMYMVAKRLLTPFKKWDAYKNGIIDENGKRLRKPKSSKDREGWQLLDRFVWALKRIVTKTIGDNKLVYLFSAAYLMKEDISRIIKSDISKYDEELKDFTAYKQKIIFEIIKEMEKQKLLVESNLDFETNLIKIIPKSKLIVDKYNLNELFGLILKESTRPTTNSLGQPIHSTREGIDNFWKWFGDSKVVDDQGRPMVVYHGSHTTDIKLFDVERAGTIQTSDWGKGIYFTPSKRSADYYRKTAIAQTNEYVDKLYDEYEQAAKDLGTTPMNAYLDLGFGKKYDQLKVYKNRWMDASDKIRQSDAGKVYSAYVKILDPYRESWGGITDPYMADRAISNGKDGIIIGDFEEVIVFKSSQIKSLDNNGNFSSNSNIITEEGEATTLGDISQFTQKIGTTQRRKFNPLIITKHANKLRKRRYINVSNNL